MKLTPIADRVAADVYTRPINPNISTRAVVRDACDVATGGELSTSRLDVLCDMVERRLRSGQHGSRRYHRFQMALQRRKVA